MELIRNSSAPKRGVDEFPELSNTEDIMTHIHRFALAVAGLALLSCAFVAGQRSAVGQTQLEMDETANQDFEKQDRQLNIVYARFVKTYNDSDDAVTHKKIIAAERAWVVYRDAESDMEASVQGEGGSIYPAIYSDTRATLTEERIKLIKKIVDDINSR